MRGGAPTKQGGLVTHPAAPGRALTPIAPSLGQKAPNQQSVNQLSIYQQSVINMNWVDGSGHTYTRGAGKIRSVPERSKVIISDQTSYTTVEENYIYQNYQICRVQMCVKR